MTKRFTFTRESYVPRGATKVSDKASAGMAFVYVTAKGRPAALAFHGRAQKPDWHHVFPNEATRERAVRAHFERHRQVAVRKAEDRAAAARPHGFEPGHVLVASWGYEQTNVDFYQVTAIVGRCMVEIRKIASGDACTGKEPWATGKSVPNWTRSLAPPYAAGSTGRAALSGSMTFVRPSCGTDIPRTGRHTHDGRGPHC